MSYENVKLWFAKDEYNNIVTIDEIKEKNNTYSCPVCGSQLNPKALESKQVTPHFAHFDASKCNNESMIHWWFKHKFIEAGDVFSVTSVQKKEYVCKEVIVEKTYSSEHFTYRPDVTIITECGRTIFFEMAFNNKKKIKDYLDIWLELGNIVVEVDIKQLVNKDTKCNFKSLFFEGKCFNTKKTDVYYNTIGIYKEILFTKIENPLKDRIQRLDWFWEDVLRYKSGTVKIEYMAKLINSFDDEDRKVIDDILSKQSCSKLLSDYKQYCEDLKKEEKLRLFNENKNLIDEGMKDFKKKIKMCYDEAILIAYSFTTDYYLQLSIKSNLNNGSYKELTCYYNNKFSASENVEDTINKITIFVNDNIEKELTNKKINQIENNTYFKEVLFKLNEKYSAFDSNYEIIYEYPHLFLMYNDNVCLRKSFVKNITKYDEGEKLLNVFDKKIEKYRNNLINIPNKNKIYEFLSNTDEKFRYLRDKMYTFGSYRFIKLYYWFDSEEKLTVIVKNEKQREEKIVINSGTFMFTNRYTSPKKKKACDVSDTEMIIDLLKKHILDQTDDFGIWCKECKKRLSVNQNELYESIKMYNNLTEDLLNSLLSQKCDNCKLNHKKSLIAKEIEIDIKNKIKKTEMNEFNISLDKEIDYCVHNFRISIFDQYTYHSLVLEDEGIRVSSESLPNETFLMTEYTNEAREFVSEILNEIKLEQEYSMKINKKTSNLTKLHIKLTDNTYIIPNDIRFKYYRDIENINAAFIDKKLISDIERFRKNIEIVFMFNAKHIDIEYEIDKLKAYGFEDVSILKDCKKKFGGIL